MSRFLILYLFIQSSNSLNNQSSIAVDVFGLTSSVQHQNLDWKSLTVTTLYLASIRDVGDVFASSESVVESRACGDARFDSIISPT